MILQEHLVFKIELFSRVFGLEIAMVVINMIFWCKRVLKAGGGAVLWGCDHVAWLWVDFA